MGMPEKQNPLDNDEDDAGAQNPGHQHTQSLRDKSATLPEELIYDAGQRGSFYHCIRVLWCGCCEPYAHITTKYVKETRWEACTKKVDSMAFENIKDVRREQTCCCLMASFAPCCPCISDMGNIVLYGSDASEQKKTKSGKKVPNDEKEESKWVLRRISHSFDAFEKITGHLQDLHADWRKVGRNLGRKIQQVKGYQ